MKLKVWLVISMEISRGGKSVENGKTRLQCDCEDRKRWWIQLIKGDNWVANWQKIFHLAEQKTWQTSTQL